MRSRSSIKCNLRVYTCETRFLWRLEHYTRSSLTMQLDIKRQIRQYTFFLANLNTWADLNRSLFSALKVERNVMFIILSLIIIVAAFNIISGLTILVKNKTKEIAILKSIGVLNKSITKIFKIPRRISVYYIIFLFNIHNSKSYI